MVQPYDLSCGSVCCTMLWFVFHLLKGPCPALPHVSVLLQVRQARETESTAEWIVDITTLADRQGRAMEFADSYSQSQLRQQNEQQLNKCLAHGSGQVMCPSCVLSLPANLCVCFCRSLVVCLHSSAGS